MWQLGFAWNGARDGMKSAQAMTNLRSLSSPSSILIFLMYLDNHESKVCFHQVNHLVMAWHGPAQSKYISTIGNSPCSSYREYILCTAKKNITLSCISYSCLYEVIPLLLAPDVRYPGGFHTEWIIIWLGLVFVAGEWWFGDQGVVPRSEADSIRDKIKTVIRLNHNLWVLFCLYFHCSCVVEYCCFQWSASKLFHQNKALYCVR